MEIFVNESSFHGQFFDRGELEKALRVFFSILDAINDIQVEYRFYKGEDLVHLYRAFHSEVLLASLNNLRDKSLKQAIISLMFNRLHAMDWRHEQVHSRDDVFICEGELVTETSVAEVAERTFRNRNIVAVLINFPMSKYRARMQLCVTKNELQVCDLNCVEEKAQMTDWLTRVLNLRAIEYDYNSEDPPREQQTVLRDLLRFQKTGQYKHGREIYKENDTGFYWYVDNLHYGQRAHLEVFDAHGSHLGEADLDGIINYKKQDASKRISM